MAYSTKPKYTHADYKAFWWKDFLSYWQSCLKVVGNNYQGQNKTDEELKKSAEFLLKLIYPKGLDSRYDCEDKHCPICNPDATPFG